MSKVEWNGYNLFKLENDKGVVVTICDLGATIVDFLVPDKLGKKVNIVLGYDTSEKYLNGNSFIGGVVGLWGNRIANGEYKLNGIKKYLERNKNHHHLHGASCNLHKIKWNVIEHSKNSVWLMTTVMKGTAGYPANVEVLVKYELTSKSELCIKYQAYSDKECPINLTQHSYFNLNRDNSSTLNHELLVNADSYWATDESQIPTMIMPVEGSEFDFREQKEIGSTIKSKLLKLTNGYDHCFLLNKTITGFSGRIHNKESGISLEFYTDQTGVQIYTGNNLNLDTDGFDKHCGICFETQIFPNQVNMPERPISESFVSPSNPYFRETIIAVTTFF